MEKMLSVCLLESDTDTPPWSEWLPIIQCKCSIVYIYGLFTWVLICVDSVFSCAWLVVLYWTLTQIVDHILIFRSFEHNSSWGYEDHSL